MIISLAYDIEVLRNFFSITFVDITDYLMTFKDCTNEKGKPIPLVQKISVEEIKKRLSKIHIKSFYISDTDDTQMFPLLTYIRSLCAKYDNEGTPVRYDIYGYNTGNYDKLMLAAFLMYAEQMDTTKQLLKKLYETSQYIIRIQNDKDSWKDATLQTLRKYEIPYINIDLMSLFALNKCGKSVDSNGDMKFFPKSLKQTSINLQWYELLEYEMPAITDDELPKYYKAFNHFRGMTASQISELINEWDRFIKPEYISEMMRYNLNDVFICCEMIRLYSDEIKLRYNLSSSYKVNLLSSSRSDVADKLFNKLYTKFSGLDESKWKGKKTERTAMSFNKVIFPIIRFETKELQDMLSEMKKIYIYHMSKDAFKKELKIGKLTYTLATGGLHTQDMPRELRSKVKYVDDTVPNGELDWSKMTDDSFVYRHFDITSYYPSLIIEYDIAPAHMITSAFVNLVRYLRDTRIRAKHSKEEKIDGISAKLMAEALKITINSIYGKLGYKFGNLYDRMAALKVTINGQLMILMLCERLELAGIELISANTDGIVVKLYKKDLEVFEEISKKWLSETKMSADSEDYEMYINRDINNYFCKEYNGKFTFKGTFNPMMYALNLQKGYDMPIVALAVFNYFAYGKPILQTLKEATNILDFCKTQNVGKSYHIEYYVGNKCYILQRNVRFYVTNFGGYIFKVRNDNKNNLCSGKMVTVLNNVDDKPIEMRNISYQYYYDECLKIIDPIKLHISPNLKATNNNKSGKITLRENSGNYLTLFDDEE